MSGEYVTRPRRPRARGLRRLSSATIVAASLLALLPASASAADLIVDDTADSGPGTLREAIALADGNPGPDTITITATGAIQLESELVIDQEIGEELTIVGPGAGSLVVSGDLGFRVLYIDEGDVAISDLTIANGHPRADGAGDQAEGGGGILNEGTLTLDGVVVRDNTVEAITTGAGNSAAATGGGVRNLFALTVLRSRFSDNRAIATARGVGDNTHASASAGAITGGNTLVVDASTFSGNVVRAESAADRPSSYAGAGGGAIYALGGAVFTRSTIVGNTAAVFPATDFAFSSGGGYAIPPGSDTAMEGVTIARNRALEGSNIGGPDVYPLNHLTNTIVADPIGPGDNCESGVAVSHGHNIDDDGSCDLSEPTDQEVDPLLAANLSDNGGPTQTLALLPGSPAIDQGIALGQTTDQRGLPRPSDFAAILNLADGSDVGAFELQAPEPEPELPGPPVTPAVPKSPGPDCRGHEATIVGTGAGETITGSDEVDVIVAGAGDDRIRGLAGNDILCGGEGRDKISGGTGFDKIEGQAGNDALNGGTGRDKLFGQAGRDRLKGAAGRDTCRGGGARDAAIACEVERTL